MRDWAGIFFYLDGKEFAFRAWLRVPAVGDTVIFAPADEPFEVVKVLWRENKQSPHVPYAEIELKRVNA